MGSPFSISHNFQGMLFVYLLPCKCQADTNHEIADYTAIILVSPADWSFWQQPSKGGSNHNGN